MVYGYIRIDPNDPSEQLDQLHRGVTSYAEDEGFAVIDVFVESTMSEAHHERPAFVRLVETLYATEAHGVIIPALDHLSRFSGVQFFMCSLIQRETGARVIALDKATEPR